MCKTGYISLVKENILRYNENAKQYHSKESGADMRYKVLITGKNYSIIDDFFGQMSDDIEAMTTSSRFKDIVNHLQYYEPDCFIYCLYNESRENMIQMTNIKYRLARSRIPFVIIGTKEDCDDFDRAAINVSDLTLLKPLTAETILKDLSKFLTDWKRRSQKVAAVTEASKPKADEAMVSDLLHSMKNFSAAEVVSSLGNGQPAQTQAAAQRKHILVVDDATVMLKTLKEYLHNDFDVATAVSGRIAMKFLERKRTDLILLDYEMPGDNGPAVLEQLRAQESTKDIPVIFLTGVSEAAKIKEVLALKPQGYLLKPVDREKLMNAIRGVIG